MRRQLFLVLRRVLLWAFHVLLLLRLLVLMPVPLLFLVLRLVHVLHYQAYLFAKRLARIVWIIGALLIVPLALMPLCAFLIVVIAVLSLGFMLMANELVSVTLLRVPLANDLAPQPLRLCPFLPKHVLVLAQLQDTP